MSATIYTFPQTVGGRQCLRDHLEMTSRFGPFTHPDAKQTHEEDWDEVSRPVEDALAFLKRKEAAQQ